MPATQPLEENPKHRLFQQRILSIQDISNTANGRVQVCRQPESANAFMALQNRRKIVKRLLPTMASPVVRKRKNRGGIVTTLMYVLAHYNCGNREE